jgi:hypothetical protein
MFYHLVEKSENSKTGPIAVTMASRKTCNKSCSFYNVCYASTGPLNLQWNKVTNSQIGSNFSSFCSQIKSLPANQRIRGNQAGDLPGAGGRINFKQLKQLINATKGKAFWTYSHKAVLGNSLTARNNRKYIKYANSFSHFTINLSADNLRMADRLKKLNIGPVVVVTPIHSPNTLFTPEGNKVIKCPNFYKDVTCSTCMLCAKKRGACVSFPAHGVYKNKINKIVS